MFTKFTQANVDQTKDLAKLLQERAESLERLAEIDTKLEGLGITVSSNGNGVQAAEPTVSVGRKPATRQQVGRKKGRPSNKELGVDKQPSLENLLMDLLDKSKGGLTLSDLVERALKTGYRSNSQNFTNMVDQALARLRKKNTLTRDDETMKYFKQDAA